MKRTKAVIVSLVIIVVVVAFVAAYHLTRPAEPKLKETLIVGTAESTESCLDPARAYDFFSWNIIQCLGSGLVEHRPETTGSPEDIIPALATSWTTSTDGLLWTFNLRPGVKYDDGTEFNATHVKYTFDRGAWVADENGPFTRIGYSNIIREVTVISKYAVGFSLKTPFSPLLSLLACPASYIVDPKYAPTNALVEYTEGDARASHPMGLGPYMLENWTKTAGKDSEIRLEANTHYWNKTGGYPKTGSIVIKFYENSTSLAVALSTQKIDITFDQLGETDMNNAKTDSNLHVWEGSSAFIQYLVLQEKYAPFNATNARQAVGAAINRTAIVQTVFHGQAQKLYSAIPNDMFGHTEAFQSLGDPNYTRTRELLLELGYSETHKLNFTLWYESSGVYPQSQQQAQALESSLEASGVIAVITNGVDWRQFITAKDNQEMEAYILGWIPDYIDPDNYIYPLLHSSSGSGINHNYNNPEMDKLITWTRGNTSNTTRDELYSQIQTLMTEDCPLIPLYQSLAYVITAQKVKDIHVDVTHSWRLWLAYAEN